MRAAQDNGIDPELIRHMIDELQARLGLPHVVLDEIHDIPDKAQQKRTRERMDMDLALAKAGM